MAELYTYPSETFGQMLLEYAPGEESGLDQITAREVVAQYAIDGQPVPKDLVDKARTEMSALLSMQSDPSVIDEMEGIIDNLDYLSKSAMKIPGYKNPAQPTSLKKQIGKQRRAKASRAAVTAHSVGGLKSRKVSRALRAISNPLFHIPKNASIKKIRSTVSKNIEMQIAEGKGQDQAIAIAISSARADAKNVSKTTAKFIMAEYPLANPDMLPGGLGDKLSAKDVDPKVLKIGMKIEMEHTSDPAIAQEIVLDHIAEFGEDYYVGKHGLLKMEKQLEKDKKAKKKKGKKRAKKKERK